MFQSFFKLSLAITFLFSTNLKAADECAKPISSAELTKLKGLAETSKNNPRGWGFKNQFIASIGPTMASSLKECTTIHKKAKYPSKIDLVVQFDEAGNPTRKVAYESLELCKCVLSKIPSNRMTPPKAPFYVHLGIAVDPKH